MTRGRKPAGPRLVEKLDASDSARQRLRVILETISGEKPVDQACRELSISEAMFYKLRGQFLQESVELLEPRTPGRKKQEVNPMQARVKELEGTVKELTLDAEAARIQTEIALTMPHLFTDEVRKAKKNSVDGMKSKKAKQKRKKRKKTRRQK
jgi:flagellar motor switch protein FliM